MLLEQFVLSLTWILCGVASVQWLRTLQFLHGKFALGVLSRGILPVLVDDCIQHRIPLTHKKTMDGVIKR